MSPRKRKARDASEDIVVRVSHGRVKYQACGTIALVTLFGIPAVAGLFTGRGMLSSVCFGTFALLLLALMILWRREAGRIVLILTDEAIKYRGRSIRYRDIRDLEIRRPYRRQARLDVIGEDGRRTTIYDEYLDISLERIRDFIWDRRS
jgi:hypothetical protein